MYAVERLSSYITRGVYTVSGPFHPFGGAVDIIVVQQQDGSFKSSPWNVRFGKFQGVLKTKEKIVNICINGTDAKFHMYLDHKGEAYFLKDANQGEGETFMSPPSSGDETDEQMKIGRMRNVQGSDCNESHEESAGQLNVENGKIVARTNSRGRRIFGFVFDRRTVKESGNIRNVERISSLERAEIAADLLEVKWSTNLPANSHKGTSSLMRSNSESHVGNTPNTEGASSTQLSDFGFIHDDNVISHHEGISDTESNIVTAEHIDETTSHGYPALRTFEEVIEIYASETGLLAEEDEVATSSPKAVEFDASFEESVTLNPDLDLYNYSFHKLSSEADGHLAADVSGEDNGDREVSSLFYCETSEGSNIMQNVSGSGEFEALNSLSIREQDRINTHETGQQASKKTLNEQGLSYLKEDSDEYSFENLEVDDHMDEMQTDHVAGKNCDKQVATSIEYCPTESPSSHDVSLLTLESFGTKIADVLQEDILKKETDQEKAKKSENSDRPSEMDDGSPKPSDSTQGFNVDQTLSFCKEAKSHDISVLNTSDIVQEPHIPIENIKFDKCDLPCEDIISEESGSGVHASEVANADILLSESWDEDHLLFSGIHNFGSNEQSGEPIIAEETEAEDHVSIASDGSLEELESAAARHDGCYTDISEVSKIQTSPVSIPKHERNSEEKEQWVGSLPNIRSYIHELEMSDVPKTSHSLHVKSETSAWDMPDKDISSCPNINSWTESSISNKDISNCPNIESRSESSMPDKFCFSFPDIDSRSESNLLRDLHPETMPENDDIQRMGEQNGMPINPAVEISLCKHLLFEGMGAEAASKAFDAEKVFLEKFAALGPSLVKNDKLVIRIAGRYYPWNAAAPIILGIASFGREGIFDAEGMIHVDGNDKALEKDPSSAIVPSGGKWRLWPFSSKKSQSMNPSHLSTKSTGITEKGTETGSMDNKEIHDDSMQQSRVTKKKVRSVTPTTEQLASLNLKEGKNLVTFSFSTAMLGRQQVDARIYLWKWNTRIVISDVDGTITKSDVLGQFMPLVGKDWSQIGVAHLFSAIKENGYQLLFLSARAISQAYLTRQFLFNLKQDGKALPDGPVVISPDGLFPSLYREVIRRAPHEFKISCLEEIRDLFPPECNPFYAGFGNRDTDEISYLKVGIPKGKIFIINPKGEVVVNRQVDTKSYTSLHALVNAMFPATSSSEQEDYNSWNYWKLPLPDIDI